MGRAPGPSGNRSNVLYLRRDVVERSSLRFVRDPIHDYVPYSALEEIVIDSPLFQRLRYVSQNALAHQTYPSNRTPRFTHSLGTMHLGGRLFQAIARNSEPSVAREFVAALAELVDRICDRYALDREKVAKHVKETKDPIYRLAGYDVADGNPSASAIAQICGFQAVRMACVLHDIGHPIFSHTGEAVLEAQIEVSPLDRPDLRREFRNILDGVRKGEGRSQLHEALGFRLMNHIVTKAVPEQKGLTFAMVSFQLARGIVAGRLDGVADPAGVLAALHELVSGDFDADRADYVQRDGYASAFEFGTYDIERIVLCLRLAKVGDGFVIRPTSAALSAVESFFVERLRIYRWLVFHHVS